jgi:hypothetical protein
MAFKVLDQVRTLILAAPKPLRINVPKDSVAVAPAVTPRNFRRVMVRPAFRFAVVRCRMVPSPSP